MLNTSSFARLLTLAPRTDMRKDLEWEEDQRKEAENYRQMHEEDETSDDQEMSPELRILLNAENEEMDETKARAEAYRQFCELELEDLDREELIKLHYELAEGILPHWISLPPIPAIMDEEVDEDLEDFFFQRGKYAPKKDDEEPEEIRRAA